MGKRARIEKDMAALDSRLAAGNAEGETRFMAQQKYEDITELEEMTAEVLQLYGQHLRAQTKKPHVQEEIRQQRLCREWKGWLKTARYRNL